VESSSISGRMADGAARLRGMAGVQSWFDDAAHPIGGVSLAVTLRPEVEVGPGRFEDWVCDGFWFGTLMERERRGHAQAGPGGSSRLTSLTNTSSKPGP
jgi:hypothetical protein